MPPRRILVFGGTGEARALAAELLAAGFAPITSLAGVTRQPQLPPGEVQIGGFGGTAGIAAFVKRNDIAALVDATHPFAERISRHACSAASDAGIPCLRLERPAWVAEAGDNWIDVPGTAQAVAALPRDARVMVTVGRKAIASFFGRDDLKGVVRMIEAPPLPVPEGWTLLLERPPFQLESELALLHKHRIGYLVAKNSGAPSVTAKILAARQKQIAVVMIARPDKPKVPAFHAAKALVAALQQKLSP
jgi:precorrin-6A/cobalt-precorrin-6A reductase